MSSSDRLFFIHAGGGKTGSSALQSALAEAAPGLAEVGIAYTHAPRTESVYAITSGNGQPLLSLLQGGDWADEGERLLESYLDGKTIGICSSEYFGNLSAQSWQRLAATAETCGIQLRIIFYVRSAIGYLAACYNQDVKRAGECRDLADYLREGSWHHIDSLRILDGLFSAEQLSVINYDAVREDIVSSFAGAFPELAPVKPVLAEAGGRRVNRSLDASEIDVMRRVNARFGASWSEELSNKLIYTDPERQGGLAIAPDIAADLRRKFEDPMGWVNERFFPDPEPRLTDQVSAGPADERASDPNPYATALDWCLEKLEAAGGDAVGHIREQLLQIDWQNADHPEIPNDFDPIAYLLLNDDLLKAGARPFQHFIDSGKQEGRGYRWPLQPDAVGDPAVAALAAEARHSKGRNRKGNPADYLRQLYQVEGLIHSFAGRERSWLEELRREREAGKYSKAELQQIVASLRQSIDAMSAREAEQARQAAVEHRNGVDALSRQGEEAQAALQGLAGQFQELTRSLEEDRALRIRQIEEQEAEAVRREQSLSRYRAAGFWQFLAWSIQPRKRP